MVSRERSERWALTAFAAKHGYESVMRGWRSQYTRVRTGSLVAFTKW